MDTLRLCYYYSIFTAFLYDIKKKIIIINYHEKEKKNYTTIFIYVILYNSLL